MTKAQIRSAQDVLDFVLAGNSRFTIVSQKTGKRITYRATASDNPNMWFISVLTGSNNETDYSYVGIVYGRKFKTTPKSRFNDDSEQVKALKWMVERLQAGVFPAGLEFWHEGRCGRCARTLTVPNSIATGFGPECAGKRRRFECMGIAA